MKATCSFKMMATAHFKDITKEAGLDLVTHSSGAFFFDYDNDGLVDLLVCNVGVYTTTEKGAGGRLRRAARRLFPVIFIPDRFEYPVLYKNLGHLQNSRMSPRKLASILAAGAATPLSLTSKATAIPEFIS